MQHATRLALASPGFTCLTACCVVSLAASTGQPVSRCYEVRTTEPRSLPLAAFTLVADLDPGRALAQHPSGLIPLAWAADARCPPPLARPPPPGVSEDAWHAQGCPVTGPNGWVMYRSKDDGDVSLFVVVCCVFCVCLCARSRHPPH